MRMSAMKKGLSCLLLALLLSLLTLLPALAFVEPSGAFYVTDKAEVLTPNTENKIISQNELLEEETGAQIAVVTVTYLDEEDYHADEYAARLMKDWGVGDGEKKNGMLLLLVTEAGKAWLSTGDGINEALDNDQVGTLLSRWFWKKFDAGDYDGAVSDLFDRLIEWYEDYYDFRLGSGIQTAETGQQEERGGISPILLIVIIVIALISLFRSGFFGIFTPRRRTWGFGPGSGYSRGSTYRSGGGGSYRSSGGSYRSGGSFSGGRSHSGGGGGRSGGGGAGRR